MSLMSNVKSLQGLYVALGGELTDTYADIANGTSVGDMTLLADVIKAVSRKTGSLTEPYIMLTADEATKNVLYKGSTIKNYELRILLRDSNKPVYVKKTGALCPFALVGEETSGGYDSILYFGATSPQGEYGAGAVRLKQIAIDVSALGAGEARYYDVNLQANGLPSPGSYPDGSLAAVDNGEWTIKEPEQE